MWCGSFSNRTPTCAASSTWANGAQAPQIGEVDCYVGSAPPDLPDLVAKLLGRLAYGLYASPQYLARHGTPQTPEALAQHRMIAMREPSGPPSPLRLVSQQASGRHVVRTEPAFETNDHWVMKTFCIDGLGIAPLPVFFAGPEVAQGVLAPGRPQWLPEARRLYCAYQRQRYMRQKLRAFVDLMARCVADIGTRQPLRRVDRGVVTCTAGAAGSTPIILAICRHPVASFTDPS